MKSGNGTWHPQDLYVMVNLPFFWCWKIGITGNLQNRLRQNSKRVPGVFFCVAAVRMVGAYQLEQWLLKITRWSRCTVLGTGGTEIRLFITALPVAVLVWVLALIKWSIYVGVPLYLSWLAADQPRFWE